ncbi:MAG: hypothetical protein ACREIA_13070 [Opitutaceae bacterium]
MSPFHLGEAVWDGAPLFHGPDYRKRFRDALDDSRQVQPEERKITGRDEERLALDIRIGDDGDEAPIGEFANLVLATTRESSATWDTHGSLSCFAKKDRTL